MNSRRVQSSKSDFEVKILNKEQFRDCYFITWFSKTYFGGSRKIRVKKKILMGISKEQFNFVNPE